MDISYVHYVSPVLYVNVEIPMTFPHLPFYWYFRCNCQKIPQHSVLCYCCYSPPHHVRYSGSRKLFFSGLGHGMRREVTVERVEYGCTGRGLFHPQPTGVERAWCPNCKRFWGILYTVCSQGQNVIERAQREAAVSYKHQNRTHRFFPSCGFTIFSTCCACHGGMARLSLA